MSTVMAYLHSYDLALKTWCESPSAILSNCCTTRSYKQRPLAVENRYRQLLCTPTAHFFNTHARSIRLTCSSTLWKQLIRQWAHCKAEERVLAKHRLWSKVVCSGFIANARGAGVSHAICLRFMASRVIVDRLFHPAPTIPFRVWQHLSSSSAHAK